MSAAATKVLPWRVGILLVTSLSCVGFSLEEERLMQHRSSKYFPQFENQGIDQEGGSRQVQSTCTNTNKLAPNASKGLSIPSRLFAKVRFEGRKCNKVKIVRLKIWCGVDPGAIVFTRGFSQNSKYHGG